MRKPAFCICENKDADKLCNNAQLISAFVFTIRIVQSLYYLNPKFQASSHLLWLYRSVCVGPGRKPRRPVFSQRGSNVLLPEEQSDQSLQVSSFFQHLLEGFLHRKATLFKLGSGFCNICVSGVHMLKVLFTL